MLHLSSACSLHDASCGSFSSVTRMATWRSLDRSAWHEQASKPVSGITARKWNQQEDQTDVIESRKLSDPSSRVSSDGQPAMRAPRWCKVVRPVSDSRQKRCRTMACGKVDPVARASTSNKRLHAVGNLGYDACAGIGPGSSGTEGEIRCGGKQDQRKNRRGYLQILNKIWVAPRELLMHAKARLIEIVCIVRVV